MDLKQVIEIAQICLESMWRFRWVGLVAAWSIVVLTWAGIYMLPNQYEAEAQVYVDTENILRPLLGNLSVQVNVQNRLAIITREMLSRPHLERVMRATDLDISAQNETEFESLLGQLERRIRITASRGNVYLIRYTHTDREKSVEVVSELLNSFVESSLGSDQKDAEQAELTLKSQIGDYEQRLLVSESKLEEFKRKNVGLLGDQNANYYQQLQAAIANQQAVQQEVRIERRKRDELLRQLEGEEPVFGIMAQGFNFDSSTASPYDTQIAALDQRITELLLRYTEIHPEVARTLQLKKELEEKRNVHLSTIPQTVAINPVTRSLDLNPIYQNIRIQLTNAEIDLVSLSAKLSEKDAEVKRLRDLVDVIPQVEAELSRLNRDYGVVKGRYLQMLDRWETLQTGQRISADTGQFKFRIIDPPYADEIPAGPPKVLLSLAAFVFAVAAGFAITLVPVFLKPVYVRVSQLGSMALPVLGSVGAVTRDNEVASVRWNIALYMLLALALFAVAATYIGALQVGILGRQA